MVSGGVDGSGGSERERGLRVARRATVAVGVLAVFGTVLLLLLVNRVGETYQDGLAVASEGGEVARLSADSAAQLAEDVDALVGSASLALEQVQELLQVGATSSSALGTAMSTSLAESVTAIANIANGMAGFIETIERLIPGNSQSLAEDLRTLADNLALVPDQLRALGAQLQTAADQLEAAIPKVDEGIAQLAQLSTSLAEAQVTLAEVGALADGVQVKADAAIERADTDIMLLRLVVLVIGLGIVLVCIAGHHALRVLERAESGSRPVAV